ncbi:GNAT family N-acetyltransferase [Allosediminivita pacifica]|nr:GNAT family N-acetyltransferase [Allosediminivita pacifica]
MPRTVLRTERLVLRRPQAGDLSAFIAYATSDRARFVLGPFDESRAFDKFASMSGHWDLRGFGRYVIEHDGRPVGHVGPLQMRAGTVPEMTWSLWQDAAEGRGIATEATRAVVAHLLEDCGWPELIMRVLPENAASLRVAERLGAQRTDKPAPEWYPGALTFRVSREMAA